MMSCKEEVKTVHLYGELKNFSNEFTMGKGTPQAYILKEAEIIKLDDENRFDITIGLAEPSYFRLGRNTLYLTPGDDLEVFCDLNDPNLARFNGKGAEACRYLRSKPFPKGGSYLNGGQILKGNPSFEMVKATIEKKVANNLVKLEKLTGVSELFRKLEKGRIMFDAANSFLSYPGYASYLKRLPKEEIPAFKEKAEAFFKGTIEEYLKLGSDADYLNLDTYRSVCNACIETLGAENVDQEILDFIKVVELSYKLSSRGPVISVLEEKAKIESELKFVDYKQVLVKIFAKYDNLQPGKPAPDFQLTKQDGNVIALSDFKGKLVVIDVWATWCGPCIAESPSFEKLAGKYANEKVKFIAISIDSNKKAWEKYLSKHEKVSEQLNCNRTEFENYALSGVPRFMLIDEQGNFIDAFAARPSDPAFEELLKSNI